MARELKLDIATGKIKSANAPDPTADEATRAAASEALLEEMKPQLEALGQRASAEPRAALIEAYQHLQALEAHPRNWITDRAKRRVWNEAEQALEGVRDTAIGALGDEGKQVWEDLPYVHQTLELYHAKQRVEDEVQRLILSPLGKLEHYQIDYKRHSAEDLGKVCQQVTEALRSTADLDDEMVAWGPKNRAAILFQRDLVEIPAEKLPSSGAALPALGVGVLLLAGGGAALAGVIPGVPNLAGLGGAIGLGPMAWGAMQMKAAGERKAALPGEFQTFTSQFRERLYLVCALRTLNGFRSKLTRAVEAFRTHLQGSGGQQRWKKVKFEGRDLTEVFATGTWDPRGTVELWLNERIKEEFRLDSTKLAAMDDIDDEEWGVLLQAFELDALDLESSTEGRLLDSVSNLLFAKRGQDTASERASVFARVRSEWEGSSLAARGSL